MNAFRTFLTAALGLGAAIMTTSASALPAGWIDDLPAWTATASSCSVDETSAGKYEFINSAFRYQGANVSNPGALIGTYQPITVRCNVTPMYDYVPEHVVHGDLFDQQVPASWKSVSWNALVVGYVDPDGLNTNAQVSVALRKLSRATLTETTIATFNSNSFPTLTKTEEVKQFAHTFDFRSNEYYVEINLVRVKGTSTTNQVATPTAYSVRLTKGTATTPPK